MERFRFENFKRSFDYLNNSDTVDLGNGYAFTAKPRGPMLKIFHLTFTGLRYYFNEDDTVDYTTNMYKDNLGVLCQFYEEHGTYDTFIFPDEQFGDVTVRFKEPLKVGETSGKRAVVSSLNVELQEVSE